MKTLHGFAVLTLLASLTACSTTNPRWEAADLRTRNEFLIQQHMLECTSNNAVFPVFHLGAREVNAFFDKYPDLKRARADFETAEANLKTMLMKDAEYRRNLEWYESQPVVARNLQDFKQRNTAVYRRLQETSQEYQVLRERRDAALALSNRLTVERIIRDYRADDRILPVAWMGDDRIKSYSRRF